MFSRVVFPLLKLALLVFVLFWMNISESIEMIDSREIISQSSIYINYNSLISIIKYHRTTADLNIFKKNIYFESFEDLILM